MNTVIMFKHNLTAYKKAAMALSNSSALQFSTAYRGVYLISAQKGSLKHNAPWL